jgi:glycine/D-amino acid oxidase-like deaminating enzyme
VKVIVVGAGIMGLCTARSLIGRGVEVTLVDALPLGSPNRASSDHHRLIRLPYGKMKGYEAMAREAFEAWDSLWVELGESHYAHTGVILIGDERSDWVKDSARALGPEECRALERPDDMIPGLRLRSDQSAFLAPQAGILMADRILASLRQHLNGVRFVQGRVEEVSDDGLLLEGGGSMRADRVVLATGAWPWPSGSPAAPRLPSRQIALYLAQPDDWPVTPFILDLTQETGFYFVPGLLGSPAKLGTHTFSMRGHPDDDRDCTSVEREALLRLRAASLPFCADWPVLGFVANYYDVTPDERFVCRFSDSSAWLGGFTGHGFKFGPLIGERLADVILGGSGQDDFARWAAGRETEQVTRTKKEGRSPE